MGKGLIIAIIVVVVAAVAGYMFLYSGETPSLGTISQITETITETVASEELPEEIAVDESGATTASTNAEESVSDLEQEIGAVDGLELPDLE